MSVPSDRQAGAYLERLGVAARPGEAGATTLAALVRAHVTRAPYENIDIYRGRPPGIEPLACVERVLVVAAGTASTSTALSRACSSGSSRRDPSRLRRPGSCGGRGPGLNANHLGVTARTSDGAEWLVDAGLGDGPSEPLPLAFGSYERAGFTYGLAHRPSTRTDGDSSTIGGRVRRRRLLPGRGVDGGVRRDARRAPRPRRTSGFVRIATVQRPAAAEVAGEREPRGSPLVLDVEHDDRAAEHVPGVEERRRVMPGAITCGRW